MSIETDPILDLAAELRALGGNLDRIGRELGRLPGAGHLATPPTAGPAPVPPVDGPAVAAARSDPAGPVAAAAGPVQPVAGSTLPDAALPDTAPPEPASVELPPRSRAAPVGSRSVPPDPDETPWPGREVLPGHRRDVIPPPEPVRADPAPPRRRSALSALSGARLLAWTGGAVTLLGVVLLMVLAAAQEWFTAEARVGVGALLGGLLVGLAMWLHPRESWRTGALAVAATGFGTLYLVVAGATHVLDLPALPAVLLALVIAAGGLLLADQWRSVLLAGGIVVGCAVLAPFLDPGDVLLIFLLLALQVAAAPVALRRRWPWVAALAAVGPVLFGTVAAVFESDPTLRVGGVLAVAVIGSGIAAMSAGRLLDGWTAGLLAAAPVPSLVAALWGSWTGAAVAAVAGLLALAVVAVPRAEPPVRYVAVAVASVALFEATAVALDGSTLTGVLLGQAVVLAVLAAVLRRRLPFVVGSAFGLVGAVRAVFVDAPPHVGFPMPPYVSPRVLDGTADPTTLVSAAVVSALVLVMAVAAIVALGRLGLIRPDAQTAPVWAPLGALGLYGAGGVVMALALLVSADRAGFTAGHAVVTVSWTVAALVLLAIGIRRPALRVTGMVLVAAAVAKLLLFDLVALDGIARVAAFLGAGLVLLAAGTRYARAVAEARG